MPDVSFDTITAQIVYVGTNARLVALDNGVKLEVKDADGNWIEERSWTE